jgi:DNA repair protein RecO (recombination protein O)
MPLVRDRCICVGKVEYSETSQILALFGKEHGLLRVIAKGAHRRTKAGASKFDGGADLLDVGEAVFTLDPARDLNTLTEWSLRDGHLELRKTLRGMYLGLYAAELVSALIEEQDPHPELFERFQSTLAELGSARVEEAFLAFELDLLAQSGHLPELAICVECGGQPGDRDSAAFSSSSGGVLCPNCRDAVPDRIQLDARLLRLAQQVLKLPRANGSPQRLPRLSRHQTDPLNRLLAEHIEQTLGKRLRMSRHVIGSAAPS